MVERIKRADVAQMVRTWKGGEFESLGPGAGGMNFQRLAKVYVRNDSNADLDIGDIVFINGLPNETDYDNLKIEYLSCGFILSGVAYDSDHNDRLSAITLEPIKQDNIGEVYFPGLLSVNIYEYNSEYKYARVKDGKIKSAHGGEYKVIGASSANDDSVSFGYVLQNEGHFVGRTQQKIGPGVGTSIVDKNDDNVILFENVKCPMLRGSGVRYESIASGSLVVVSKNFLTGEWQIIEAQCDSTAAALSSGDEGSEPIAPDDSEIDGVGGEEGGGE